LQLLVHRHGLGTGARGFSSYIYNICAIGQHCVNGSQRFAMVYATVGIQLAPVGERIWGCIENTHHSGLGEVENFAAAPEFCHKNCAVKSKKPRRPENIEVWY
jgi:hypothetical protein